jgi:hypothetical protein
MGMKYFAYGEKMFSAQLHRIIEGAKCLGTAKIMGYRLCFHNRGHEDPSGKCNIVPVKDPTSEVFGVLYDIPPRDRYLLDKSEGLGFGNQEITLKVFGVRPHGNAIEFPQTGIFAFTYIAHKDNVFEDLVPFSWYKEMVVSGAKEHQLPPEYIHHLEQFASSLDPNEQRANKQKRYLESTFL